MGKSSLSDVEPQALSRKVGIARPHGPSLTCAGVMPDSGLRALESLRSAKKGGSKFSGVAEQREGGEVSRDR